MIVPFVVPFVDLRRENEALQAQLIAAFNRVLGSGRYLMGSEVARAEREIATWFGLRNGVGVASGTDACELAIRAVGWGEGTRVLTPAFGAVPTINAIEAAGATPVLVDVDPLTRGVSAETIAAVAKPGDGAIVVHMFGVPCYVPPNSLEDCAHAMGAFSCGRAVGTLGLAGCLSFFPTKCLGNVGDGGMVVTNDWALAERVRELRHYGGLQNGDVCMRGQNSRLSELSAAILMVKLRHVDTWNARRFHLAQWYIEELGGRIVVPTIPLHATPTFHCFVIEHPERDRLASDLLKLGVNTMVHYPKAIHQHSRWEHLGDPGQFPVAERLAATVLSLPLWPSMTDEEAEYVIKAVRECT